MDSNGTHDYSYLTRQLVKEQGSLDNLLLALYEKENTIKGIKEKLEKLKVEGNFYTVFDGNQAEESSLTENQFGFNHPTNLTDKHENDSGVSESEPRPSSQARIGSISSPTKRTSFGGSGRRSSKRIAVKLIKQDRLGFIVSAKDNPASDRYPIIKKICPDGPLITNGQTLKANDKLIQVNDIEMLGKSHDEVVQILKNIPSQCSVELVIARQETDISPNPSLPRPLPSNKADDISQECQSDVLTFDIPPNTSVVAGLGISVKGRKTGIPNNEVDVGLFVNKIINGGTACIDGRLRENDRIISINGKSLVGLTNDDAMKELEKTFASGKGLESITITIARCITSPDVSQPHPVSERLRGRSPSSNSKPVQNAVDEDYYYPPNRITPHYGNDIEPYSSNSYSHTVPKFIDDSVELPPLRNADSSSSLENGEEGHFHRDGFGRQSISEKKHASLNAKNTDTYQRNKKAKEERERERLREESASLHQPGDSFTPGSSTDQPRTDRLPVKPIRGDKLTKNTLFPPACCWSCQSPGSCPYHVSPQITSRLQAQPGSNLGLKKSSSLESLQTAMQDVRRGQYTPNETNAFVVHRPATLKVSRPRHSNENFRPAINRSYDAAVSAQQVVGSYSNEINEGGFPVPTVRQNGSHFPNNPSDTALSIAPSQFTSETATSSQLSTIDNQDEATLIKRKNSASRKSGLMRTLLRFGSGKKKRQSAKSAQKAEEDQLKIQARQAAQLEQERIQEHYKKLKEQQKAQQQAQIHSIGIPTHDSHLSTSSYYRSDAARAIRGQVVPATPMGQQAMKLNAHAALYNSGRSDRIGNHVRTSSGRAPPSRHYPSEIRDRPDRYDRVHPMPQQFTNGFGLTDPLITYSPSTVSQPNGYPQMRGNPNGMHTRVNSFDVRETMDRSNSGKFNHYINYRDTRPEQYSQQQPNYVTREVYSSDAADSSLTASTGDPNDRSVPMRRLQMGTNQILNASLIDSRRKRPLSSYEIITNSPNFVQSDDIASPPSVNFNYIQRSNVNFSSLPRRQVNNSNHNVPRSTYQPI